MEKKKIISVGEEMIKLLTSRGVSQHNALFMLCSLAIDITDSGRSVSKAEGIARVREAIDILEVIYRENEASTINNGKQSAAFDGNAKCN